MTDKEVEELLRQLGQQHRDMAMKVLREDVLRRAQKFLLEQRRN